MKTDGAVCRATWLNAKNATSQVGNASHQTNVNAKADGVALIVHILSVRFVSNLNLKKGVNNEH